MRASRLAIVAAVLAIPATALAVVNLTSTGGFLFDIQEATDGTLSNGSSDAYDVAYRLAVNGTPYNAGGGAPMITMAGRNVIMGERAVGVLLVQRHIYVPAAGGDFGRYLDVITNSSAGPVTATVEIDGNLGSDFSTIVHGTSSGDAVVSPADTWFGTDDVDGSGDPSLAHVFQGATGRVRASAATLASDNFSWSFTTTIPAGGRAAFLTFAIQKNSQAEARAEAMRLVDVPSDVMVGLDPFLDDIVNFDMTTPGAPRVQFTAPASMEEGTEQVLTVTVTDLEGDAVTWSWDTDDDGTFGELPGMTSYTVPAGTTDGPGSLRVGVQASDGTNVSERTRTLTITNVDPTITSTPPTTVANVCGTYVYEATATDPAGALDPLTFALVRGPMAMAVAADGRLSWTPSIRDVTLPGETISVEISVSDDDMGVATQAWAMIVSPNCPPSDPIPLTPIGGQGTLNVQPRLVAQNAVDPDRDSLVYYFDIDSVDSFDSVQLQASGPLREQAGFTAWVVNVPLARGHYFWRVWVDDGTSTTTPQQATFSVVAEAPDGGLTTDAGPLVPADTGTMTPPPESGCCSVPNSNAAPHPAWLTLLVALFLRRRRQ